MVAAVFVICCEHEQTQAHIEKAHIDKMLPFHYINIMNYILHPPVSPPKMRHPSSLYDIFAMLVLVVRL